MDWWVEKSWKYLLTHCEILLVVVGQSHCNYFSGVCFQINCVENFPKCKKCIFDFSVLWLPTFGGYEWDMVLEAISYHCLGLSVSRASSDVLPFAKFVQIITNVVRHHCQAPHWEMSLPAPGLSWFESQLIEISTSKSLHATPPSHTHIHTHTKLGDGNFETGNFQTRNSTSGNFCVIHTHTHTHMCKVGRWKVPDLNMSPPHFLICKVGRWNFPDLKTSRSGKIQI